MVARLDVEEPTIREVMNRIAISKTRARRAGDPLNLLPENRRAALNAAKDARKTAKRLKLPEVPRTAGEAGIAKADVVDRDLNAVTVKVRGYSLAMFAEHRTSAADRFSRDWQMAFAGGLKAQAYDMAVDGGAAQGSRTHLVRLQAQGRIQGLRAKIGERAFLLLEAIVIKGKSPGEIHRAGGPEWRLITHELSIALDAVSGFYGSDRAKSCRMMKALHAMVDAAES